MAAGVVLLAMLLSTGSVGATHELTVGTARYSDGTLFKDATVGDTLALTATGTPPTLLRSPGLEGGVSYTGFRYRVAIGKHYRSGDKDIPCYLEHRFVSGLVAPGPGNTLPSTPFVADVTPGEWEVCFYSQPYQYVTTAVQLSVTAPPPPARTRGFSP